MTDGPERGDAAATDARVARLERRLERERAARHQAERIAEDGMRALWAANRELEARVAERTTELERSLAAANTAADAKERFLAELGHDLATPLHNVIGLLELIDDDAMTPVDRRRMGEVTDQATHLADLLRSLVDLAGAEGAPTPDDVSAMSPSNWLDDVVRSWTTAAARRAQLLVPTVEADPGDVRADWQRLGRALDMVLSNVVVHAGPGPVTLALGVDDRRVHLVVSDSGPGISEELAATAHQPFVAAGASRGVGVGLSIAVRLLESAGGSLGLEADTSGTTVELIIPLR